jgi:hypothetical protein
LSDRDIQRLEARISRIEARLDALAAALGLPADESPEGGAPTVRPIMVPCMGYEYRSPTTLMGIPLIHIATGVDPQTWRPRVAKGWVAIGNIAVGGLALGGMAFGGVCVGGIALGVIGIGGLGVAALLALGGVAIGYVAAGGAAIGYWAVGGGAAGVHVVSANHVDPAAVSFFGRCVPGLLEGLNRAAGPR